MGNTNEREALKSIALPFPPYNPEQPALWFRQIESCFYCTGITDELIKYHILVSRLEPCVAELIQDFLAKDSDETTDKYSQLKTKIIGIQITKSELEKQQIGDRRPSEFLRCLEQIASKNPSFPTHLVRSIWISGVRPHVSNILLTNPKAPLERLCFIADILHSEDQKKEQQQQSNKPQGETLCNNCQKYKKVTLEVNCINLCEILQNIDSKNPETRDISTQTALY
ncbi:unnamed protein product [Callosobruchus maculatus]|uniref:DUF7041 domain-containing protein n=1 Tax=Callosobruchus maculatus TaxID=64391 RepID=A0A653DFP1_CALMS|nr:unnamed protein product [Callosobruchus maculatus]